MTYQRLSFIFALFSSNLQKQNPITNSFWTYLDKLFSYILDLEVGGCENYEEIGEDNLKYT